MIPEMRNNLEIARGHGNRSTYAKNGKYVFIELMSTYFFQAITGQQGK